MGLTGDAAWEYFEANCTRDDLTIIEPVKDMINLYYKNQYEVIFLTSRSFKVKEKTQNFLNKIFDKNVFLITRDENDYRQSSEFKESKLGMLMRIYDIRLFIDDDLKNCYVAQKLGIVTLNILN